MSGKAISRRELLSSGLAAGMALGPLRAISSVLGSAQDRYAPFKVGIQSYSLRGFGFVDAIERTKKLGLTMCEPYPSHLPVTADAKVIAETHAMLKANGVRLMAWGVQGFDGNETTSRRIFEFAKAMKIEVISADPAPDSYPVLEKLVAEYRIPIAIHNHGPGSRWSGLADVQKAVDGRHPLIGACIDTGHALRSGEDPVEWAKALGKRVFNVHLKDVKDKTKFTVLGKGDLRLYEFLQELRSIRYGRMLALEYEENPQDPMKEIEACLESLHETAMRFRA